MRSIIIAGSLFSASVAGRTSAFACIAAPYYHHRTEASCRFRLYGTRRNKSNGRMISSEDQDALCNANSRFFQCSKADETRGDIGVEADLEKHLSSRAKHITSNTWPRSRQGRQLKKRAAQPYLHGVEIRRLEASHPLSDELGLYAVRNFCQFDIVGEYCGEVFDSQGGGEYATYLEDRSKKYALGVDASSEGNECRFINHFRGIAEEPNVIMKIGYVENLPRVMIVCTRDIDSGEELLLKYSDEYVEEYLGV